MLGKLTIDALPFYSGIAMGGALITVFGALGVVALDHLVRPMALSVDRMADEPRP